jgi:hypothetical protein
MVAPTFLQIHRRNNPHSSVRDLPTADVRIGPKRLGHLQLAVALAMTPRVVPVWHQGASLA